jgi:hypothetical protein
LRLYIDIDTGEVSRELNGPVLGGLVMYLRDILALEVVYVQAGAAVTSTVLANNAVQKIGLKAALNGTTLLALATTYTLAANVASSSFSLNTDEAVAYFADNVPPGARDAQLFLEFEVSAADESRRTTYCQLPVTVRRDVNQPGDTDPSPVDASLYVLKGALFDGNGYPITPHFVCLRPDVTNAAQHRALITAGRSRPWVIITLESDTWCTWTLRTRGVGESDDGDAYRVPSDYHATTNNVIWVRSAIT